MPTAPTRFADLGVPTDLCACLTAAAITEPFPIQSVVIPDALAGRDVAGRAPTGSGKTLAFGLPLVSRLRPAKRRRPTALVLVPTRELAQQIARELRPLVRQRGHDVVSVYGGVGYGPQRKALEAGVELVVACPGRLEDLIQSGLVSLGDVHQVVVDEADRMADMGFLPSLRRILELTGKERQVLLFSATFDGAVSKLAGDIQRDPVVHEIGPQGPDISAARHVFWRVDRTERTGATAEAIKAIGSTIVFCRTRHGADRLTKQLDKLGVAVTPIHGGRSQAQRDRAVRAFARGDVRSLIATDVAARGVHVDDVAGVIHFDPPEDANTYTHRSGRTARAGKTGVVVSLVDRSATHSARQLQREVGIDTTISHVDLDALLETRAPTRAPAPVTPGRARGVVKFFNGGRGYGFIDRGTGVDLFVHHSSLTAGASLPIGATVEFNVRPGRKGDEAHDVELV
jgi:superfamily II DNA/RNA helicase/cold shock CspA family protein